MADLAPVAVFAFNRPRHLQTTLHALAADPLAADTDVFVFADGPRNSDDARAVAEVAEVLTAVTEAHPFRTMHVQRAAQNRGLAPSVIDGASQVLDRFKRIIVLEDDVVPTPHLLSSMNIGLDRLDSNSRVWSLSGYSPPIRFPREYSPEAYLIPRASSWGWATWQSRWKGIKWERQAYAPLATDTDFRRRFAAGGRDLPIILDAYLRGDANSWAIRWCAAQCQRGAMTVYPRYSLVTNAGTDGSGTNSPDSTRYRSQLATKPVNLSDIPEVPNQRIVREFSSFQLPAWKYWGSRAKVLLTRRKEFR